MLFEAFLIWTVFVYLVEIVNFRNVFGFVRNLEEITEQKYKSYNPLVSVIIPFKGLDYELEKNIKSILSQNYKKREFIFVYDGVKDPVYKILRKFKGKAKLIKSKHIKTCSGKVAALISGVEKSKGSVLVFGDSDIRPTKNWLAELIKPLSDKSIGVTTSYRLYFPIKNKFISALKYTWDASHIGLMISKYRFVWGGSFALTRQNFDKLKIISQWKTSISDDIVITKNMRKSGLDIRFSPKSIVATYEDTNWEELKEWSNRQMFFVKNYDKKTWKSAFYIYGYFNLVWLIGIVSMVIGIFTPIYLVFASFLLFTLVLIMIRDSMRESAIQKVLPEYREEFGKYKTKKILSSILTKPLTMYNIFKVRKLDEISWRGRKYSV
ncbi:MAG: glycosyltransferase family 2 protein [Candidatus Aenigmatarchaeota archaeon]